MEETGDNSGNPAPQLPQVGTIFQKKFGHHGIFTGTVKALPTETDPYYRVVYEDGDQEDLSGCELFTLLGLELPEREQFSVRISDILNDHDSVVSRASDDMECDNSDSGYFTSGSEGNRVSWYDFFRFPENDSDSDSSVSEDGYKNSDDDNSKSIFMGYSSYR